MKFILALFFIPLTYAGSPPDCKELGTILQGYEKDLNGKAIKDCGQLKHEDLLGDRKDKVVAKDFLKDKTCLELGDIETQTERLKAELAVLDGIDKLKIAVKESKEKAEQNSRVAGLSFVASLNTAQSLELLVKTKNKNGDQLLEYLKKEVKASTDLIPKVQAFCKELDNKGVDACNPEAFKPGDEASKEIISILNSSEKVNSDQIKKWQDMLAIKRKNPVEEESEYSFHIMQTELSSAFAALDNKEIMSKAHLAAIKRLDDFENNPKGLSFVEDINSIKDKKKTKILSDKLFLLMGDAKSRQQFEMQSKVSVLYDNYKERLVTLSESEKSDCELSKSNFEKAKVCTDSLKKNSKSIGVQGFDSQLDSIKASLDFIYELSKVEGSCKDTLLTTELLPEECYKSMDKNKAEIQDQILQLNVLKDKIGSENLDLMTYRNLALNKWYNNSSCGKVESVMDLCDTTDTSETISKMALMTMSESMSVAVMFNPKPDEEVNKKAEELCGDDRKKKTKSEERLCEFFNDTTTNVVTKNEDNSDGPVTAPDGGHAEAKIRDAWLQGGANLLAQGLSTYLQRNMTPPPVVNPYPYNYAPYSGSGGGMGIADSIMFNARYQGAYGFYMPTQGLPPGQAFPSSSMSGYQALSGSGSKYFGR
jgi:hypothetical protein